MGTSFRQSIRFFRKWLAKAWDIMSQTHELTALTIKEDTQISSGWRTMHVFFFNFSAMKRLLWFGEDDLVRATMAESLYSKNFHSFLGKFKLCKKMFQCNYFSLTPREKWWGCSLCKFLVQKEARDLDFVLNIGGQSRLPQVVSHSGKGHEWDKWQKRKGKHLKKVPNQFSSEHTEQKLPKFQRKSNLICWKFWYRFLLKWHKIQVTWFFREILNFVPLLRGIRRRILSKSNLIFRNALAVFAVIKLTGFFDFRLGLVFKVSTKRFLSKWAFSVPTLNTHNWLLFEVQSTYNRPFPATWRWHKNKIRRRREKETLKTNSKAIFSTHQIASCFSLSHLHERRAEQRENQR